MEAWLFVLSGDYSAGPPGANRHTASETLEKLNSLTRNAGTTTLGERDSRGGTRTDFAMASMFFRTEMGLSFQRKLLTG